MYDRASVDALGRAVVEWTHRGFPGAALGRATDDLGDLALDVRRDFSLPVLALRVDEFRHNLATMASFCATHGVGLAPHAKTSMSPQIVAAQLDLGAWGITVATVSQARVFRQFGVRRMILANGPVSPADLAWIGEERRSDPAFELYCLVDSAAQVERLAAGMPAGGPPLSVLLELGIPGGRSGARTVDQAMTVARSVTASAGLRLAGIEGFEGIAPGDGRAGQSVAIRAFLDEVRALASRLRSEGLADGDLLVTFGGSAYFDLVVEALDAAWRDGIGASLVLRSGCYVTHDDGYYASIAPVGLFRPALAVFAAITSTPEPGTAIAGFGRRDVPADSGLPVVRAVDRGGAQLTAKEVGPLVVRGLNDHHGYLDDPAGVLRVGDVLTLGISHPCTAFDKWRLIPVIDRDHKVLRAFATFF